MTRNFILGLFALTLSGVAHAACPTDPPPIDSRVNMDEGDTLVDARWLEQNLAGHRVEFAEGTEHYQPDGGYSFTAGSNRWDAPSYRFYDTGWRCIDYPTPRFDLYVVNDARLVLIAGNGLRSVGQVMN